MVSDYIFDWADLAFGSKKPLKGAATFVLAPRAMSEARLSEIIKAYLPQGDVVLGIAKESYIEGFEGQLPFRTLSLAAVQALVDKVAAADVPHKLYCLQYFQREVDFVIDKLRPKHAVLVNGSWHQAFHTRSTYYVLTRQGVSFEYISPFSDESEAESYADQFPPVVPSSSAAGDEKTMLLLAEVVAKNSFDTTYQTGCVLGRPHYKGYEVVTSGYNRVIPYQTAAWHHGSARERHYSMPGDTNYYDTIHAEMDLLISTLRGGLNMVGRTLFITTLPCPNCARTLSQTGISEVVYEHDHSEGYAVKLFEQCGIKTRRVVL